MGRGGTWICDALRIRRLPLLSYYSLIKVRIPIDAVGREAGARNEGFGSGLVYGATVGGAGVLRAQADPILHSR